MDQRTQQHQKAFGGVAVKVPSEGEGRSHSIKYEAGSLTVDRLKQHAQAAVAQRTATFAAVLLSRGWKRTFPIGNVRC